MQRHSALSAASTIAALLAVSSLAQPALAEPAIGLTSSNALFRFDTAMPLNGSSLAPITGLQVVGERILSIDLRPTTGVLYGVSSESRVYSIGLGGQATFVGGLGTTLTGTGVGIDFNPVADLAGMASLRVSTTGQNIAYNVATGTGTLATPIQGGIVEVAYSNNDIDPSTSTALYYLDAAADQLKFAAGAFNAPTITTVGNFGLDINGIAGFDISSTGLAFAALAVGNSTTSGLYSINLATGAASMIGGFGIGGSAATGLSLIGITSAVTPVPEPGTYALMAAGLAGLGFFARRRANRTTA